MSVSKKLVLPKFYLRTNNVENDMMEDELLEEEPIILPDPQHEENVSEAQAGDNEQSTTELGKTKKRAPTQYNIFIKETLVVLASTRQDLVGKERFKYAVHLWNEKKKAS